ncbi:DsbA family oxidoreductase [Inquilinus sp. NPDC058860]|uniref:DsbA family oxidoreductase n=1 Tax=Inquilinus sp. NPDC058860 TaxID=3346652 RepID=UPI0036B3D1C5
MTLAIDLYTEITCPWCIIGMHRLDKVLAERFPALAVDIRHHPVMLMPDCPPEGLRIADLLRSRYGVADPTQVWERPHSEARASGLDLDLRRQPFAYPTLGAHTLIRLAAPRGTQHALAVAITSAYFQDGRNIADPDGLADIASKHGFERKEAHRLALDSSEHARTFEETAASAARGVKSVPRFVFGERLILNGCRSEDEIAESIRQAASSGKDRHDAA